mgnify:CR=1 FL=1
MIEVNNITKKFIKKINKKETEEFYANNNISFTAEKGEILGMQNAPEMYFGHFGSVVMGHRCYV